MSESIVLLALGACWAAYLSWYWRENRRTASSRRDGIRAFASGLGSLGGSTARAPHGAATWQSTLLPRGVEAAARRRRDVLVTLTTVAVLTFFAAISLGPLALFVHVVADLALAGYAYALVQRRNEAAEREMKVTMLYPDQHRAVAPVRRVVNG